MAIQKITSGIIQDGAIAAADIVSVANTAITGNITSSQIAPDQTFYGNVSVTGTLNTPNTFGFKNRIINGGMVIGQRNAGAAVTANEGFPVDRFKLGFGNSTGAFSAQQTTTAPAGFINSVKYLTTTADVSLGATEYATLFQPIEGLNVADLAWGTASASTVTLSFWCRSSVTGTFGGALRNSSGTRSYPFTFAISVIDTWEQKTITIAGDTSGTWLTTNGVGIYLNIGMGTGTTYSGTAGAWAGANYLSATGAVNLIATLNADFYITGVQLEKGSTATSFDFRDYGRELAMCQRYYQNSFAVGNVPGTSVAVKDSVTVTAWSDGNAPFQGMFPVPMRVSPTVTLRPRGSVTTGQVNSDGTNRAGVAGEISEKGVSYIIITTGTVGAAVSYTYECSSEL